MYPFNNFHDGEKYTRTIKTRGSLLYKWFYRVSKYSDANLSRSEKAQDTSGLSQVLLLQRPCALAGQVGRDTTSRMRVCRSF